ncbi:MAG: phosphoribosylformylglycinamidine synthase subunit PurQ, partial [Nitrospinae bacterium]|nr:phosphoribosylformylglycinamidine synthase subunit PurQ [Nitrospinota bacterium]
MKVRGKFIKYTPLMVWIAVLSFTVGELMVRVASLFFHGMVGSLLPVVTAHGEGRAQFHQQLPPQSQIVLQYVGANGNNAVEYPQNPNGSPQGITGLCNSDG